MNKRKDMNTRLNYSRVNRCYNCEATEEISNMCYDGAYNEKTGMCVWKQVIENDLEKISKNGVLTFPILKDITKKYE